MEIYLELIDIGLRKSARLMEVIPKKKPRIPNGLTTLAEFIYPEITQEQFLGKKILLV